MQQSGLRERSKARRRDAIEVAGLRLFTEHGYSGTTLADIAEAAEVSPRTVSMYFPTKLDIALGFTNRGCERLTEALEARQSSQTVVGVLDAFLQKEDQSLDKERKQLVADMMAANPSLPALRTPSVERLIAAVRRALAADLGLPEDHFKTRLGVATLFGVLEAHSSAHLDENTTTSTRRIALDFLAAALATIRATP
ncbi:TetR/AcrR family transcriptional regulator [Subtercola frigoramans]|uniref:AcrR family transcriptional regulator n=1 Tax=Subtercola frigoramans TaxID=120298 RepID=A0ABS2L0Y2_9MICO|nr:TetR/AcrR family transcriptional regulator [Subtercola frigoramans]MBM7470743.1 AcrR family transcriptional regulator [Subtercola frigoramans]